MDWTSGNEDIDKIIQNTQLLAHNNADKALEWIPYNRLYNIKYIEENKFGKVCRANWMDGKMSYWDDEKQNWKREGCDMFVNLISLNIPNNLILEFINKIKINYEFYGIIQDPKTKNYMIVLDNICGKCSKICNAIHFQRKFIDWTSEFINKFKMNHELYGITQDSETKNYMIVLDDICEKCNTQLLAHNNTTEVIEWIPYDRLHNIEYIINGRFGKEYKANWIDGCIQYWNNYKKNWQRVGHNTLVILKSLDNSEIVALEFNNEIKKASGITQDPETKNYMMSLNTTPNNLILEFINKIKINHELYGITQDLETKNYMIVLDDKCEKCNKICNTIYFQRKFMDWTSEFINKVKMNHRNSGMRLKKFLE
ncbi:kinase-like domain-containing protein [Rhizophagus irregularis DAOM 181602=DAOM 197198]|nr:kinase-like domain-containing protein [Rhizophagus irregularis DAOM 181602=DAOM 197198]